MKSTLFMLGLVLLIAGIVALGYQGFTYTQTEKVAQIGSLVVTADKEKTVYFPPILGAAAALGGIILMFISRKR